MSRRNSLFIGLILAAVLVGLTACSPLSPVDRQPASPVDHAIGRLTSGDASVDLVLRAEGGDRWALQATYTFPAGRYTGVLLIVARSDQPIVQRQTQDQIAELPVVLRQELPDLKPGQWVNVSAAVQLPSGDMTQLGVARLEAVAGPEGWRVIELSSAAAPTPASAAPTVTGAAATASATGTVVTVPVVTVVVTGPAATATPIPSTGAATATPQPPTATAVPPTATPAPVAAAVSISAPAAGASLTTSAEVRGTASAFENQVTIQVLDARGQILGQQQALVQAEMGQAGPFQVSVPFPQVTLGQEGTVRAYVVSPKDGSVVAEASVKVRLVGAQILPTRQPTATPTPVPVAGALVEISEPAPNAILKDIVVVRGRARAFENELTVQVRELDGTVLGQAQVIFRAEPGEIGEWEARVDFDDPATARPGQVYAFTISPKDGSIAADDVVSVRLAGRR